MDFTAVDGVRQVMISIGEAVSAYWPGGLLIILVTVLVYERKRVNAITWLPFLVLPFAYGLYFYAGVRFVSEGIPLAMVATAILASWLCGTTSHVRRATCWLTVLLTFAAASGRAVSRLQTTSSRTAYFHLVEDQHERSGRLLVFVGAPRAAGGLDVHRLK